MISLLLLLLLSLLLFVVNTATTNNNNRNALPVRLLLYGFNLVPLFVDEILVDVNVDVSNVDVSNVDVDFVGMRVMAKTRLLVCEWFCLMTIISDFCDSIIVV